MNNSVDRISIIESRHGPSTGASAYSPPNPPEVWASAKPRDGPVHPAHQPVLQSSLLVLLLVLPLASLSLELSPPLLIPQHPWAWPLGGPLETQLCQGSTRQASRDLTAGHGPLVGQRAGPHFVQIRPPVPASGLLHVTLLVQPQEHSWITAAPQL